MSSLHRYLFTRRDEDEQQPPPLRPLSDKPTTPWPVQERPTYLHVKASPCRVVTLGEIGEDCRQRNLLRRLPNGAYHVPHSGYVYPTAPPPPPKPADSWARSNEPYYAAAPASGSVPTYRRSALLRMTVSEELNIENLERRGLAHIIEDT